jgi:hypothetical protein
MSRSLLVPILAVCALLAGSASAGECLLTVTRTACKGKEADSYAKCGGDKTCDDVKKTATAADCAVEALKACINTPERQGVTKSKVVTARFEGAAVEGGKNFCDPTRGDFNKCK